MISRSRKVFQVHVGIRNRRTDFGDDLLRFHPKESYSDACGEAQGTSSQLRRNSRRLERSLPAGLHSRRALGEKSWARECEGVRRWPFVLPNASEFFRVSKNGCRSRRGGAPSFSAEERSSSDSGELPKAPCQSVTRGVIRPVVRCGVKAGITLAVTSERDRRRQRDGLVAERSQLSQSAPGAGANHSRGSIASR